MNNKEILKSYNNKLIKNNDDLQTVINMVNNLPDIGDGPSEDLTEEMASYDEKLTTQETTLSDIVSALTFKAKPTPEIKPRYIHLIKDGVEQVGNTGGIQIKVTTGDATQGQKYDGDGYLGLGAKIWSDVEFNISNKFDLTEYTILVVEWAYPKASSPYARQNAVAKLVINPYQSDNRENVLLTSSGATVARRKDTYIITKATGDDSIAFHLSNTFDSSSETPVTAYPVQIFNLYLENPNANVQDKIVEINENGTTIVLPDEGYAALNSVEVNVEVESNDPGEKTYLYLIKDGVEQTNVTGGYTLQSIYGGTGNNTVKQGDGFMGLCAQIWSCWTMTFKNKIDFARYPKLYIEYAYPQTSTPYASSNVEFSVYRIDNKKQNILINKTGVKQKTLDVLDFSQDATIEQLQVRFGNNGDGSKYANYPIQLFNLYFEENPKPLQNKKVEITKNGVTSVKADDEYYGLNRVDITTLVSTGGYENILDNTDYSPGQWNIGSNGSLTPGDASDIYRFNKLIPVIGGETLYLSKGLVLHFNVTDTSVNYNTTGDLVITVPTGATQLGVRTFAADAANFNPDDYIISRTPITEGGGSSGEVFSTEEIMTNEKWIDGKPIYRKVFTEPVPTITHGYETYTAIKIDISDINYDTIVDFSGTIEQANHDRVFWGLNWYNYIAGASAITNIIGSEECIQIRLNSNWLKNGSIIVILEYTKRTD